MLVPIYEYMTTTFDPSYDLDFWIAMSKLETAGSQEQVALLAWNETDRINTIMDTLYGLVLWPHPWPWIFKVKFEIAVFKNYMGSNWFETFTEMGVNVVNGDMAKNKSTNVSFSLSGSYPRLLCN